MQRPNQDSADEILALAARFRLQGFSDKEATPELKPKSVARGNADSADEVLALARAFRLPGFIEEPSPSPGSSAERAVPR